MKHEGGFNKVFEITMDNGAKVIARLPTRVAGPTDLVTHSEVATLAYCKAPIVCAWKESTDIPNQSGKNDESARSKGSPMVCIKLKPSWCGVHPHGVYARPAVGAEMAFYDT